MPNRKRPNKDRSENSGHAGDPFPDAFVVTTELDLHGFYPEQVPPILEDFLQNASERAYPEVKIIHGKGRSTLKRAVLELLEGHPLVESYRDAWDSASGWGATIVRMRKD